MVFMSPIVIFLSGVSWPASSIPSFLYSLAHLFPSTIMIPAYLRVRTMGVGISEIRHEYGQMLILMCFYFCTAAGALYVSALHNSKQIPSARADGKE
jgi:ABC-2 type transport system permease protein